MENVEPAVGLDRHIDHRLGVGGLGHVGARKNRLAAGRADRRHGLLATRFVDIDDHDARALLGKEFGRRPAHA